MKWVRYVAFTLFVVVLVGCAADSPTASPTTPRIVTPESVDVVVVAKIPAGEKISFYRLNVSIEGRIQTFIVSEACYYQVRVGDVLPRHCRP